MFAFENKISFSMPHPLRPLRLLGSKNQSLGLIRMHAYCTLYNQRLGCTLPKKVITHMMYPVQ